MAGCASEICSELLQFALISPKSHSDPPEPPHPPDHQTGPVDAGSQISSVSLLSLKSGAAAIIQFPPEINGENPGPGSLPYSDAGPPKQKAIQADHVNVGVTKIL